MDKEKLDKDGVDSIFLLVGLGIFSKIRTGDQTEFSNVGDSIGDFVYNNGVSVNVIKRSYELDSRLRSDRFYSLHFLHDGVFGLVLVLMAQVIMRIRLPRVITLLMRFHT